MYPAKNNVIVKIQNSKKIEYAILNPVSGSFDLMDEKEYGEFGKIINGEKSDSGLVPYLLERGYLFKTESDHCAAVSKAYSEFKEEIAKSQIQLMLVPTYGCNLDCTYCFQHGIEGRPVLISKEAVDAFFDYAGTNFSDTSQKPFITLFGGEPLVNSPSQRNIVQYIVEKCVSENYELSAVTNGYDFIDYVDILKKAKIKEIQFTLDGSREIHDKRRGTANKKGTFDRIILGIQAAVDNKMPVNLRSVVDTENIEDIIKLAEFLDGKGWLDLPAELFKTQIGRNYELFDCYAKPQHLMTQVELWSEFASLSKSHPVLAKFHRPDFKGIRYLVDTGEMYMASFDTCPACKTEWVFDLYGDIYGCTASCGREEYLLGSFWPEAKLNTEAIGTWKNRDVKSIAKCRDCKYDVICGGGCGVVAANQAEGNVLSPDCRPIQELLEIGVNHYISDIKAMSEESPGEIPEADNTDETKESCCKPVSVRNSACCGSKTGIPENIQKKISLPLSVKVKTSSCCTPKKTEGCVICGTDLIYSNDSPSEETCYICGNSFESYIKCPKGHYICDNCHSMDILEKVEKLLVSSEEKNPIELAKLVFDLPGLNMHGPEYHSIVPAVLVAAQQNYSGIRNVSKILEAMKRGKDIKGGFCGLYGNCGSGVGAGIASAIINDSTSMKRNERGAANRATGHALLAISRHGGPRCCKREAITSIESFIKNTDFFEGLPGTAYTCKQSGKNKDCIHRECPYFPKRKT